MENRSGNRLSYAAARELVQQQTTWLRDYNVGVRLGTTHATQGITSSYDTLVVDLPPSDESRQMRRTGEPRPSVTARLLDLLVVWHAVSRCRGYSFQENLPFWVEEGYWSPGLAYSRFDLALVNHAFPRVVLSYSGSQLLQLDVLDLFTLSLSPTAQQALAQLEPFTTPSSRLDPVDCVVRVRFGKTAHDTDTLLNYLGTQAERMAQTTTVESPRLRWTGVELVGRRRQNTNMGGQELNHLKPLQALNNRLPPFMTLAMRFPRESTRDSQSSPSDDQRRRLHAPALNGFLRQLCGFQGSEFHGRLQVLDLVDAFAHRSATKRLPPDFACLCSLLPFTTSLRELRVRITRMSDALWLTHAMFHPQSRQSKWNVLRMMVNLDSTADATAWDAANRLVRAEVRLPMLMAMLQGADNTPAQRLAPRRVARTVKRVPLYDLNRFSSLASLARGCLVEICDSTTDWNTIVREEADVVVLVPGYGFGYIATSSVALTTEEEQPSSPLSCITSLHVSVGSRDDRGVPPSDQLPLLRLFGASLKHLYVNNHPHRWFHTRGFSSVVPNLETIDCCSFSPETASEDLCALPKLRALGLASYDRYFDQSIRELLAPCILRGTLRELRLECALSFDGLATAAPLLKPLVGRLQHLVIEANGYSPLTFDEIRTAKSNVDRRKCAFLSAVHYAQKHTHREVVVETKTVPILTLLARMDSYLIRLVFVFYGPSLESLTIGGLDQRVWHSGTKNEIETRSDAWANTFARD